MFLLFQSVYNLLGETLSRLQQFDEAERWYQAALQAQPDHVPAHITYGKLLAKNVCTQTTGSRMPGAHVYYIYTMAKLISYTLWNYNN